MADGRLAQTRPCITAIQPEQWEEKIKAAMGKRGVSIKAQTYRNKRWETASRPVLLACSDGQEYVVKGRQNGKLIANEQIVAHLARVIGAPVPEVKLVDVSAELIGANAD